jgi:hypothetical protein
MSGTITNPTVNEVRRWFEQEHVTITFTTESGSHYTLVRRPKIAVLIRDNTGEAWKSDEIEVDWHSVKLQDKDAYVKWETTGVVSFFVLSN